MFIGIKSKALLIGTMAASILISGCGVEKDSDDKVMLVIDESITEVTSDGQEILLDIMANGSTYWQYDSDNNLLISSSSGTSVSVYDLETGTKTEIGFPSIDGKHNQFEYEGQEIYAINAWYEEGNANIYAANPDDDTLIVFTFDRETEELVNTAYYDIPSPFYVREAGNLIVYTTHQDLNIYDKTTGEDITVASGVATVGSGFDLIVLNSDGSKVLFIKKEDDVSVLYEYDIPSGETREVYRCSEGNFISGFTYALDSNKIYLRYGKKFDAIVGYGCLPNHTMVITTDGRTYELHSSYIDGYDWNTTGIVIY